MARPLREPQRATPDGNPDAGSCNGLRRAGFDQLVRIGRLMRASPGGMVFRQGDRADSFAIIATGRCKTYLDTYEGHRLTIGLLGPTDIVGLATALRHEAHARTTVAIEHSTYIAVSRGVLLDHLVAHPGQIAFLLPKLTQGLVHCRHCMVESCCQPVEIRIARLFLRLMDDPMHGDRTTGRILLRLTRAEIAELAATTLESASRVMSRWRRDRLVFTSDAGFRIIDIRYLKRIACLPDSDST